MAGERKITIYFFLFAIFIFLAFIIGTNMYATYKEAKTTSEETTKSVLDCTFNYYIRNLAYSDNTLTFNLETSDEKLLAKLVLVTGNKTREVPLGRFFMFKQDIRVEGIVLDERFSVFPEGCEVYNTKECSLVSGKCLNVKKTVA